MKKYRVLREMPFVKIGDVFNVLDGCFHDENIPWLYNERGVSEFIKQGYIEEIDNRKSLAQVFKTHSYFTDLTAEFYAEIAKQHYLSLFDEAVNEYNEKFSDQCQCGVDCVSLIRQKLEKGI